MIFVTVGEQLPFDRLINAVDDWASHSGENVFAQTGTTSFVPKYIAYKDYLPPLDYSRYFSKAELIISHAGMGTIISALEANKKIIVMPRIAEKGEHRNDHQLSTVKKFESFEGLTVAGHESQLHELLRSGYWLREQNPDAQIRDPIILIERIKSFVNEEK